MNSINYADIYQSLKSPLNLDGICELEEILVNNNDFSLAENKHLIDIIRAKKNEIIGAELEKGISIRKAYLILKDETIHYKIGQKVANEFVGLVDCVKDWNEIDIYEYIIFIKGLKIINTHPELLRQTQISFRKKLMDGDLVRNLSYENIIFILDLLKDFTATTDLEINNFITKHCFYRLQSIMGNDCENTTNSNYKCLTKYNLQDFEMKGTIYESQIKKEYEQVYETFKKYFYTEYPTADGNNKKLINDNGSYKFRDIEFMYKLSKSSFVEECNLVEKIIQDKMIECCYKSSFSYLVYMIKNIIKKSEKNKSLKGNFNQVSKFVCQLVKGFISRPVGCDSVIYGSSELMLKEYLGLFELIGLIESVSFLKTEIRNEFKQAVIKIDNAIGHIVGTLIENEKMTPKCIEMLIGVPDWFKSKELIKSITLYK